MQMLEVELRRKETSTPWGFRLAGGTDMGFPLQVDKVTSGSLAERRGMKAGDLILNIGGDNTLGMTHMQAKQAIIRCGHEMELTLSRGHNQQRFVSSDVAQQKAAKTRPMSASLETWPCPVVAPKAYTVQNGQHATMTNVATTTVTRSGRRMRDRNFVTSANIKVVIAQPAVSDAQTVLYRAATETLSAQGPTAFVAPGQAPRIGVATWTAKAPQPYGMLSPPSTPGGKDSTPYYNLLTPPVLRRPMPQSPQQQQQHPHRPADVQSGTLPHAFQQRSHTMSPEQLRNDAIGKPSLKLALVPAPAPALANLKVQKTTPIVPKHFNNITPAGYNAGGSRKPAAPRTARNGVRFAPRGSAIFQQPKADTANCSVCNVCIRGPYISALEKCYCPAHFTCSECNATLTDVGFAELEDGRLVCERDYADRHAPFCRACGQKILEAAVKAMDALWHTTCFKCSHCSRPLNTDGFHVEDGKPYCTADYNELFQVKCEACLKPILAGDTLIEAMKKRFHSECFRCAKCNAVLQGKQFCSVEARPYCTSHAPKRFL